VTEPAGSLPPVDDELLALVEAVLDDTATAAERDRLDARLRSDPAARALYVAYLDLHACLQWRTRGGSVQPVGSRRSPAEALAAQTRRRPRRWVIMSSATAATVLLAIGLFASLLPRRHGPDEGESPDLPVAPPGSVAVLIDNSNTVWDPATALPTGTGSALPPGRLKLKAGVAGIAFLGGGEVLLEGPADFDVSAPDSGFLHRGRLTARVPDGTPALRVSMPGVVVTDTGGECGLLRDESGVAEVHVFAGQVGADPTDGRGATRRLAEQAAVRLDALHRTMLPVPLNETAFAHLRPEVRVIDASVRDGRHGASNFGTASRLVVKKSIPDYSWETYLRFDLAGVKGKVGEATVRLVPVRVGTPVENAAALVADNQWGETALTWDTKPPSGPELARWTPEVGQPVEIDVTRFVQDALAGDKKLSLRLFAPKYKRGGSYVEYGSREGDPEARPQLLVTTARGLEARRSLQHHDSLSWLRLIASTPAGALAPPRPEVSWVRR
jgi:hypothetical protein